MLWFFLGGALFVLAVAGIWIIGALVGAALSVKIILTAIVLALAAIAVIAVRIARIRRANRLERELFAQGARQLGAARGRERDQLQALEGEVRKAIVALKQSRLGTRGGKSALYALPWYVIVGPPGAGKTTAIRHSGLRFPLDHAAAYRGTGGTRNCTFWFSTDAVLLDTAGRYTTSDDDRPEWLAFLDLLKRHRKHQPINGLILAVPITDVIGATEAGLETIARQLRARIDEVTTQLDVVVPVYVVFTKIDLVTGFTEAWADLRKSDRGQIWGATLPYGAGVEPRAAFEQEFELLTTALQARTLRRAGSEHNVEVRRLALRFPRAFAGLKDNLGTLLAALFQDNAYQEKPSLRGVYFTSGTQTVNPTQRAASEIASAMRLPTPYRDDPNGASALESKSYFLTDLFQKVVFPDRDLALRTAAESGRQLAKRAAFMSVAAIAAALLVVPSVFSYAKNRDLVRSTAAVGHALESATWNDPRAEAANGERLVAAERRVRQLDHWRDDRPIQLGWGMYTGDTLYERLRDVYGHVVTHVAIDPVARDLESSLRAIDAAPVRTTEHYNSDYDELKLSLMLGDPGHLDPAWAAPRIVKRYEALSHSHGKSEGELLLPHVLYVCELMKRGEVAARRPDAHAVTRARSILAQVPQIDRLYESLVRDANAEIAPIRRETIFYGSVGPFIKSRSGAKVDGAYTKQGWLRVKALLGTERAKLAAERWVLGEDEAQINDAVGKLREVYFERYKIAWRDLLADVEVADPGNAEYALAELNALSEPEWPYLRLVRVLADNVVLDVDEEDPSLVKKVADKIDEVRDGGAAKKRTVSSVERAFRPILRFGVPAEAKDGEPPTTGLAQWELLISRLVGTLTDFRDGAATSDPKKMSEGFQEAFRATSALLSEQDGFTRPLMSPLLMQPITLAWANVVKDAGVAASATWELSVWPTWHDKLEGKYPFAASRTDASLEDFVRFFGSTEGSLWGFYDESLKATLDRHGSTFVPSRRFKSSVGYSAPFLDVCLKRGAEISDVLFTPKSERAVVAFDVNLHSVSPTIAEVTLEIDGASRTYKNEPEQWLRVEWPGKTHGARLRVRGAGGLDEEIARSGDFGLFRLLDAAELASGKAGGRAEGSPTTVATFELRAAKDASVRLDLRPARSEHPFSPNFFRGFTCPRSIAAGR